MPLLLRGALCRLGSCTILHISFEALAGQDDGLRFWMLLLSLTCRGLDRRRFTDSFYVLYLHDSYIFTFIYIPSQQGAWCC
jgi:hypothetical protein